MTSNDDAAAAATDSSTFTTTNSNNDNNDNMNGGDTDEQQQQQILSISTLHHIRDIVNRAPFVDAQNQQFVIGSRSVMVAAIDEQTGEILRVIPKFRKDDDSSSTDDDDNEHELPSSLEGRDVVWIGRLEYTVTIHDLQHGNVDIEFSVAEILSVDEMLHGYGNIRSNNDDGGGGGSSSSSITTTSTAARVQDDKEEKENERIFTDYITDELRHPKFGNRILRLPAPPSDDNNDKNDINNNSNNNDGEGNVNNDDKKSIVQSQGSPFLVSTPSGNVAFRDTC